MSRADTIPLTYTANITDLRKKLGSIPGITGAEARKAVRELSKSIRAVEREQKKAREASASTAHSLKELGDQAGDSETSLRAIGGVLGLLSPQAEAAVAAVAELGGGLEGVTRGARLMGASLPATAAVVGTVTIAAGAAAIAIAQATREMELEAEQARFLREVNASLEPSIRAVEDAQLALALATGQVSEAQAEATERSLSAQRAVLDFAAAQQAQREELQATIETQQRWLDGLDSLIGPVGRVVEAGADAVFGFSDKLDDARGKLASLDRAVQSEAAAQQELKDTLEQTSDATERQARASSSAAEALRDQAAARRAHMSAIAGAAAAQAQLVTLQEDLAAGGDEWAARELAINRELDQRVALLDRIAQEVGYTDEVNATFLAATEEREARLRELQQERFDAAREGYATVQRQARESADAVIAEERRKASATRSALSGLATASGDAIVAIAEANSDVSKEGMLAAWRAQQALAAATIPLRLAEGLATAAALPPIAAGLKRAEVIAVAAGSAASIASASPPEFNDTPGVMQLGGRTVRGAPGDYVAMAKDLDDLGSQVDRARGRPAPTVQVVAVPSYQGRTYDRARRDAIRRPGPDFEALNRDRASGPGGW